jgi:uncharacterized membrane protein
VITAPRRRTPLILAIALTASLCLNLFLGGAWLAGRWFDRRVEATATSVMRAYPPEIRRDVLRRLLRDRTELRAAVAGLRDARQRMFAVMRTDPLDRSALGETMAEVRARTGALQALLQAALADSLMETPVEERRQIRSPAIGLGLLDDRSP